MSDAILKALDELKAGQDSLKAGQDELRTELLGALSQSNEAVVGAIQALSAEVQRSATKVDRVDRNLTAHMAASTDSFARIIDTLQAMHGEVPPSRLAGGSR